MLPEIVNKALEILKKRKSGSCVKMIELIKETNLCDATLIKDELLMMDISMKIVAAAKKERIFLESIFGDDVIVDTPSDITYVVKRKYDKNVLSKENCIGISYKKGGHMCCEPDMTADVRKKSVSSKQWETLMEELFNKCKPQNWYDTYENFGILDGYYWELKIKNVDGKVLKFAGSNEEPENLIKLKYALNPWMKRKY